MATPARTLNVNVGILGHVDAGKTSLVRALSTELSTAALDKHPASHERGITLDLGFSAFTTPPPPPVAAAGFTALQFTLVDCPGHASLIRTIIGGSQIMDMAILVVDIVKGVQTQTAECLVIAEITTDTLVVVLNKVDALPADGRDKAVRPTGMHKAGALLQPLPSLLPPPSPLSCAGGAQYRPHSQGAVVHPLRRCAHHRPVRRAGRRWEDGGRSAAVRVGDGQSRRCGRWRCQGAVRHGGWAGGAAEERGAGTRSGCER